MLVEGSNNNATPDMSSDSTVTTVAVVPQPSQQDDPIEIIAPTGMLVGSPSPQQQQPSGGLVEYQHGHDPPDTKEGIEELCPVCGDKVSGYHYGLLTCESCKGFFKRTVQNKKVYTCVADRSCHIDKSQRKRCPYCRFQKCLDVGMKLEAVRADRMRGGRNKFGPMYKRDRARKLQMMRQKQIARAQCQGVMTNEVIAPPFTPPSMPAPSMYNDPHIKQELIQIPQLSSSTSSPDSSPSPLCSAGQSSHFAQVMGPMPPDQAKVPAGPWSSNNNRSGSPHLAAGSPKSPYHYGAGDGVGPLTGGSVIFNGGKLPHLIKEFQQSMPEEKEFSNQLYGLLQNQTYNQCEVDSFELLCKVIDQSLFAQVDWARNSVFFKELKVDDQMKLLQQSWSDMLILDHLHQRLHNGLPEEITMPNGQKFSLVNLALLGATGMQNQLSVVSARLQELKFDVVDYICLKFMLLLNPDMEQKSCLPDFLKKMSQEPSNPDARNLSNIKLVHEAYERTQQALMEYTLLCYPNITDKFTNLLSILPEIHVISDRGEDYLLYRHINGNPTSQTLLMEMLHAKKK